MAVSQPGDVAYLPQELFQMILYHLDPVDIVRCRRVCTAWSKAFANAISLIPILKRRYPLAKEVRALSSDVTSTSLQSFSKERLHALRAMFDRVAERYYRLTHARPRGVQKFNVQQVDGLGERALQLFEVAPWEYHSSHFNDIIDMAFDHAFWTYEEGLLVFPSGDEGCLTLLDLETQHTFMVPFVTVKKVIRRLRLHDRLLIIEWAEDESFHWLNEGEGVHRHFATAFELNRAGHGWDITRRNEWKIMFLGHPLGDRDRFYSTHSRNHYAIYVWQPNRSLYTAEEDAPIESLSIWDISQHSEYMPSQDPTGRLKDGFTDSGPSLVTAFSFRELGFYSVRQGGLPGIMRLDIHSDSSSISVTETGVFSLSNYNPLEYTPKVTVTTIPFIGQGPAWQREVGTLYPPYRGNCAMEPTPWTVTAPWPCFWGICEAADEEAHVSFCLSYLSSRYLTESAETDTLMVTIHALGSVVRLSKELSRQVSRKGKICGDERFLIGENDHSQLVVLKF